MSETILHNNMLSTRLEELNLEVATNLPQDASRICWTGIWEGHTEIFRWVFWYNFDRNDPVLKRLTPGGLAEAHEAVVAKVKAGLLPPPLPPDGLAVQSGAFRISKEEDT